MRRPGSELYAVATATAAAFIVTTALSARAAPPSAPTGTRGMATQSFRDEHVEVRSHLEHARTWTGQLESLPPAEQKQTAKKVVAFFQEHIAPHAHWEEQVLYPMVDRLAGGGAHRFTATMRHEHAIVGRWIDELAKELAKPSPDFRAFTRRADNLFGLIDAHFEEEEQVLLPLIDASMSREQFEAAVKKAENERRH